MDAAAWLRSQGVTGARSMAGGIDLWATEIDPKILRY
jgi:rhodanese-related sulfurtransferase